MSFKRNCMKGKNSITSTECYETIFSSSVHFAACERMAADARMMYTRRTYLPTNSQQGSVPCLNIAHTSQLAIQPKGSQLAKPGIPWNTKRTISNRKWHGNLPPTTKKKNRKKNKEIRRNAPHFPCGFGCANGKQQRSIFRPRDRTHGKATHPHITSANVIHVALCPLAVCFVRNVQERWMKHSHTKRTFPTLPIHICRYKTSL